jgi:hypothetical protein
MQFLIKDIRSHVEKESDYETAVELSTTTIQDTTFVLEHDSGVLLEVELSTSSMTSSYLEPDFSEDHEPGQPYVYVSTPSDNGPVVRTSSRAFVGIHRLIPLIDTTDTLGTEEDEWPGEQDEEMTDMERYPLTLTQEIMGSLEQYEAGQMIDLSFSPTEEIAFKKWVETNRLRQEANIDIKVANRISDNVLQAKKDIDEQVQAVRRSWKGLGQ